MLPSQVVAVSSRMLWCKGERGAVRCLHTQRWKSELVCSARAKSCGSGGLWFCFWKAGRLLRLR